ncbi:hypothetical protein V5799_017091 [Amblyomma americanum]|uniref:Uncharacterized protein n=1 Tax=Amblyomma americanum TaxID=6943 RepID=A0AAQ4F346_AMBAM
MENMILLNWRGGRKNWPKTFILRYGTGFVDRAVKEEMERRFSCNWRSEEDMEEIKDGEPLLEVALSEQAVRKPAVYLKQNVPAALREYPRLISAISLGLALAIVFPVFGCCLLTCRCCCGACGGDSKVEEGDHDRCWRCVCFLTLGACCVVMTVAAGFAVVANLYTYAGIADVLPYTKRSIGDLVNIYHKTQDVR